MPRWLPLLILLCCSCERRSAAWGEDLTASDPFDRFLAAVALAEFDGPVQARVLEELVRVSQGPDRRMRETAIRIMSKRPDHAVRTFFELLDRKGRPSQAGVKWTGSSFERALLERLGPALNHPECAEHGRLCDFVATLPERKRRDLLRLSRGRERVQAGE